MSPMPCPHARYHRTICPDCNGENDVQRPQLEIEQPQWDYEIAEKEDPPKTGTVITFDI